jgi:hypothetical protein
VLVWKQLPEGDVQLSPGDVPVALVRPLAVPTLVRSVVVKGMLLETRLRASLTSKEGLSSWGVDDGSGQSAAVMLVN